MAKRSDLSAAEFEIMDVIWRRGHATVKEIQAELGPERKLAHSTICTLLGRIKEKGYVQATERNFAYEYRPLIERDRVVQRKLRDLVHRVLGGDVRPLATYIVENTELTDAQIEALAEIVRSHKGGD